MTPITHCPPAAAHSVLAPDHQFAGRHQHYPVSAEVDGEGEMVSRTGLSFDDYARMQTTTRRTNIHWRTGVPEWTRNHSTVRAVLVRFFEERAFPKTQRAVLTGTEAERLARACEKLRADTPRKLAVMDRLCNEYILLASDPARQRKLKIQIEGIDTQIRMAQKNWPAVVLGILYQAYNVGQDSVGVGAALGLKPPCVRQTLSRLNQTWRNMTPQQDPETMEIIVGADARAAFDNAAKMRAREYQAEKQRKYTERKKEREEFIARYRAEHGWPATARAVDSQAAA